MLITEQASDLNALVSGIRLHKGREDDYIHGRLRDIRRELQHGTRYEKSQAVLKLWYLRMLGYDVPWFPFGCLEVMSSGALQLKRPGFSACAASFTEDTPVALLTVNLFKKELLQSLHPPSANLALTCMAGMCTTDVARDLHPDVLKLLASSKPFLRRKALLCLLRMMLKYPPAMLVCYDKVKEALSDPDPSVVACALSVAIELAMRNPKHNVQLVPAVYNLLVNPASNWILLKSLRLLNVLCTVEPRLPPKLMSPLNELLNNASLARSIEVEILRLALLHYRSNHDIVKAALQRLTTSYLHSTDVNLKCVGLLVLSDAIEASTHLVTLLTSALEGNVITKVLEFVAMPDVLMRQAAIKILQRCVTSENFLTTAETLMKLGSQQPEFLRVLLDVAALNNFAVVDDLQGYSCLLLRIAVLNRACALEVQRQLEMLVRDAPTLRVHPKPAPPVRRQVSEDDIAATRVLLDTSTPSEESPAPSLAVATPIYDAEPQEDACPNEYAPEVLLLTVVALLGTYSEDLVSVAIDSSDVQDLMNFAQQNFAGMTAAFLKSFSDCAVPQHFAAALTEQLACLAQHEELSSELRLRCSVSALKILGALSSQLQTDIVGVSENPAMVMRVLQNPITCIKDSFLAAEDSKLQFHGKLLSVVLAPIRTSTAALFKAFASPNPLTSTSDNILQPNDLRMPFSSAGGIARAAAAGLDSKHQGGVHEADSAPAVRKRHALRSAPVTGTNDARLTEIKSPRVWSTLFTDERLAIYGCILGRSSTSVYNQSITYHDDRIPLALDIRCRNLLPNSSTLTQVKIQEDDDGEVVLLSSSLKEKSSKVRMILRLSRNVCMSGDELFVLLRISYEIDDNTKINTATRFKIPFYYLLQPLKVEEDTVFFMMKSCPAAFTFKEFETRDVTLSERCKTLEEMTQTITSAPEISHFHCLWRSTVPGMSKITALLVGTVWSPHLEAIQGLDRNHTAAIDPAELGTLIAVGLLTITLDEGRTPAPTCAQLHLTFRGGDANLCKRLAIDVSEMLQDLFRRLS